MLRKLGDGVLVCAALFSAALHAAQSSGAAGAYPARNVRLIVPFAPGGSDVPARMLAAKLSESMGHPFVVDNRPGASGVLGADIVSKAAPDGYTLLFCTASHAVTPSYYQKLPYDAIKDFVAVASVGSVPFTLVAHPSLGVTTVKEFVAFAKGRPGKLNYASPGIGSIGHLANVLLAKQTGIEVTHVGYKGTGPAVAALLAGEVQFMMPNLIGALPHVRSGRLRMLAIAATQRAAQAPETPTFAEAGVRDAESGTWYGVLAPRGTPQAIVDRLNRDIVVHLRTQGLRDQFATIGVAPDIGTPQQFASFIRAEIDKWSAVMKFAGMKPESY